MNLRIQQAVGLILAAHLAPSALAAVPLKSVVIVQSTDGDLYSRFVDGFDPDPDPACPTDFTCTNVGDGDGTINEVSATEWAFEVLGTSSIQNFRMASRDTGDVLTVDVQIIAQILDEYAGSTEGLASIGLGLRDGTSDTAYFHQCLSPQAATAAIISNYGTTSADFTSVDGAPGQSRPRWVGMTYDASAQVSKCWASADGSAWVEVTSVVHAFTDMLAYGFGQANSATIPLSARFTDFEYSNTIDIYTPSDPGGDEAPVCLNIPNQVWTKDVAITAFDVAPFCVDAQGQAMTFTDSGLPGGTGLSMSSAGVFTGTPTASDIGIRNITVTAEDTETNTGSDIFQMQVVDNPGDSFPVPTGAATATYNCQNITDCGPGDEFVLAAGSHGKRIFRNLHGKPDALIIIRNNSSGQASLSGSSGTAVIECLNCTYYKVTGLAGWSGNNDGCGPDFSTNPPTRKTDCGIKISGSTDFGISLGEERRFAQWEGFEIDGGWSGSGANGMKVGFSPNDRNYCQDDHPGEFVEGIEVNHFWIYDVSNEALYYGPNIGQPCDGVAGNILRLRNVSASYGWIEDAGYDGIELKSAFTGTNVIHHMVIKRIGGGIVNSGNNARAISMFESSADAHSNWLDTTITPPGGGAALVCDVQNRTVAQAAPTGVQRCNFYGNVVISAAGEGILIRRQGDPGEAGVGGDIYSNTVINSGDKGISVNAAANGGGVIRDNISVGNAGADISNSGSGWTVTNNLTGTVASAGFTDAGSDDYTLTPGSPAHDADTSGCPSVDMFGITRPQGVRCDQGALELDE